MFNFKGYKLRQGDIVRLGKVTFKVINLHSQKLLRHDTTLRQQDGIADEENNRSKTISDKGEDDEDVNKNNDLANFKNASNIFKVVDRLYKFLLINIENMR